MTIVVAGLWSWVTYLVPFLFVLGVVVVVHELGHFLVARYFGVSVETFSVGFGHELWCRYDKYGTKWRIAALPLGGYVKFKGDENAASMPSAESLGAMTAEERAGNFHTTALYKRAAIVAAGPFANLLLAVVVIAAGYIIVGKQIIEPVVASVEKNSAAERAGILPGDVIRKFNDTRIESIDDVQRFMARNDEKQVSIVLTREGREITLNANPELISTEFRSASFQMGKLGLNWSPAVVGGFVEGGAGEQAGLKVGDKILRIEDKSIESFTALADTVRSNPGKPLQFIVERNGQTQTFTVTPKVDRDKNGKEVGLIGVKPMRLTIRYERQNPVESLKRGIADTYYWLQEPFVFIGKMFSGRASPNQVSSFIGIAELTHDVAEDSIAGLFNLLAVISVQIGLINLFPIPVLDGGHLLFYGIEAIRGRPMSERTMEISFRIGISLMIMLMLFAMRNDVIHLFRQWG